MHWTENKDNYLIYQDNYLQVIQFLLKNSGNFEDFRAFSQLPYNCGPYYKFYIGDIFAPLTREIGWFEAESSLRAHSCANLRSIRSLPAIIWFFGRMASSRRWQYVFFQVLASSFGETDLKQVPPVEIQQPSFPVSALLPIPVVHRLHGSLVLPAEPAG
ncbi:MAG: hypothetical protein ACLQUW_03030 [Desulfobaccales bacterium]